VLRPEQAGLLLLLLQAAATTGLRRLPMAAHFLSQCPPSTQVLMHCQQSSGSMGRQRRSCIHLLAQPAPVHGTAAGPVRGTLELVQQRQQQAHQVQRLPSQRSWI
jgi:hypothetical protein